MPRLTEQEQPVEHRQWQTVDVECTEEKVQGHGLLKVLNGQGKLAGNMVTIQPSQ